jgi:transcriptional regulator with XRE-family HTH domain
MRDLELGRVVRALRRRLGWRQENCAARASVHRSTWSMIERGHIDRMPLAVLRRCLDVLEIRLELVPGWRGADLSRLRDSLHAALQARWKARLERWGWHVWAEHSFNHYGDRGRIDLLVWHPVRFILLVVEVKCEVDDARALLGGVDVKARLAPVVAQRLGLHALSGVVPMVVVGDGSTTRDRLLRLAPLFCRFTVRGRAAMKWLRQPSGVPSGLLALTDLRFATGGSAKSVAAHRVRVQRRR